MTIEETQKVLGDAIEKLNQPSAELARPPEPLYIGDGVYASYDPIGGMIRLGTQLGSGGQEIWLEREVYETLRLFATRCGWDDQFLDEMELIERRRERQDRENSDCELSKLMEGIPIPVVIDEDD